MRKQATQQIAPKIYISHSVSENVLAQKIRHLLKSSFNANVFMNEDLSGGEEWEPQLRRALSDSDYVVVLLTPQSIRSTFVLMDLGAAWGLGKPIICIVTQPNLWRTVTVPLNESQIIEVTDIDDPASSKQLVRRFSQILESRPV